jgi:hypothetical protein
MTKDEVLDLVLDWLVCYKDKSMSRNNAEDLAEELITAIKQARSAPVQEPSGFFRHEDVCGDEVGHPTPYYLAPPAAPEEPVAWMGTDIEGNPNKFRLNPFNGGVELYKKPQSVKVWDAEGYDALMQELELWKAAAQRKWVGLTPTERKQIEKRYVFVEDAIRLTEAKLKEKNGITEQKGGAA